MLSENPQSFIYNIVEGFFAKKKTSKRTPSARSFNVKGVIEQGINTDYAINEMDIVIDEETWTFGELEIGAQAAISGVRDIDGTRYAKKVMVRNFG